MTGGEFNAANDVHPRGCANETGTNTAPSTTSCPTSGVVANAVVGGEGNYPDGLMDVVVGTSAVTETGPETVAGT